MSVPIHSVLSLTKVSSASVTCHTTFLPGTNSVTLLRGLVHVFVAVGEFGARLVRFACHFSRPPAAHVVDGCENFFGRLVNCKRSCETILLHDRYLHPLFLLTVGIACCAALFRAPRSAARSPRTGVRIPWPRPYANLPQSTGTSDRGRCPLRRSQAHRRCPLRDGIRRSLRYIEAAVHVGIDRTQEDAVDRYALTCQSALSDCVMLSAAAFEIE